MRGVRKFRAEFVNHVLPDYQTNIVRFDTNGNTTEQLLTLDNTDTYDLLYSGGSVTKTIYTDVSASANIKTFTVDFAGPLGTLSKSTAIYDNLITPADPLRMGGSR